MSTPDTTKSSTKNTPVYYSWTTIRVGGDDAGKPNSGKTITPGSQVSASDLGVSDEEFQAYIDSGAVRTQKYPELPPNYQGSPVDWYREQANMSLEQAVAAAYESAASATSAANLGTTAAGPPSPAI